MFAIIWKALENKKMTIGGILAVLIVFAMNRDWLMEDTGQLLTVILGLLGLTGNVIDANIQKNK